MKNKVQLIAYIDRLSGGGITDLAALLRGPLQGLFSGVHLLPFFYPIDGADAGFDPVDHSQVDPHLGSWQDIRALGEDVGLTADLIANHISRASPQFHDYLAHDKNSAWAELFLTREQVFPNGATQAELQAIYRPRPGLPFCEVQLNNGEKVQLWTTFTSEQIDIDVTHPLGKEYLDSILRTFAANGVGMVRLDAVGYTIKQPGSTCFMLPETLDYIAELSSRVRELGMEVLVEIHAHYSRQIEIAQQVDWVYDFALPPLVLHAFAFHTAQALKQWLNIRPVNALTVLDTHDGIGVIDIGADLDEPGLVPAQELDRLVETIHSNSKNQSRLATGAAASNLDLYQVNCTYYDAMGRDDLKYLLARALQFFVPGIPQIYYVGLLAGENDMDLLQKTSVGRDINRHYYTPEEVESALQRPVVKSLCVLIHLRNEHPAFQGKFRLGQSGSDELVLRWEYAEDFAELMIGFSDCRYHLCISVGDASRDIDLLSFHNTD